MSTLIEAQDIPLEDPQHSPDGTSPPETSTIDRIALLSLAAQHFSITWTQRTAEFASYLFLIDLFPTTLLPSGIYGLCITLCGILLGGNVGAMVDIYPRVKLVRTIIFTGKLSLCLMYGLLLCLLVRFPDEAKRAGQHLGTDGFAPVWILFTLIVIASSVSKLCDIGLSVAIERDWVISIADGSDAHLTTLNLWMRRIDLVCKLASPLFASLLTSTVGNSITIAVLMGIASVGLVFELVWLNVVWRRFPSLHRPRHTSESAAITSSPQATLPVGHKSLWNRMSSWTKSYIAYWIEFIRHPVFPSSLSISLLYFTTLSFDGSMISWLKTNTYSDALISGMRGLAVCTGLCGTVLMPYLEKRVGLARTGSWSIWFEAISLIPVTTTFFVGSEQGTKSAVWNQTLLFGGVAISRIGLWSFDLCQLKLLQLTLADHPRRNTLTGLQYSLQNVLDSLKYVMIIIFSQPDEFKYTAVLSMGAVVFAASFYLTYLRRERGHIFHTEWLRRISKKLL